MTGKNWTPAKARAMHELIIQAGQTGSKHSVVRIAERAGVSPDFVRSLRGADFRLSGQSSFWTNRETTKVNAVLAVLGVTPDDFEKKAASA